MEINRQKIASVIGVIVVMFHIVFSFLLWFSFNPNFNLNGEVAVAELSTPLSAAFALGVIKWVIDTQGKITSDSTVGFTYSFLVIFVSLALFSALAYGPYAFSRPDSVMTPASLNSYFLVVESIVGGMFGLFFNDMFGGVAGKSNDGGGT